MRKIVCIGGLNGLKNEKGEFISYEPRKVDSVAFKSLGAKVEALLILNDALTPNEISDKILSSDIIYVGYGNTRFMLEKWREKGVEITLRKVYNKGIVLAGMSAGSYCWFDYNYDLIQGLGFINAVKRGKFYE